MSFKLLLEAHANAKNLMRKSLELTTSAAIEARTESDRWTQVAQEHIGTPLEGAAQILAAAWYERCLLLCELLHKEGPGHVC